MLEDTTDNNLIIISGDIDSKLIFSHEIYGEGFYSCFINVHRLSNNYDRIPITFSERLINLEKLKMGIFVEINGQFRSYNNYNESHSKLVLNVFAKDIKINNDEKKVYKNQIYLNGYLCKKPIYRVTPLGREIADLLVAVNRAYNKSDYIPCIAWGRNARFSEGLSVASHLKVWGRVQSRKYQKRRSNAEVEMKIAFEMSVSKMELSDGPSKIVNINPNKSIDVKNEETK